MPRYCPTCFSEFNESLSTCPTDKTALTKDKPKEINRLIDAYAASDEIEAERIITFLRAEGVVSRRSVTGLSQMPVISDTVYAIAVLKEQASLAKQLISQAREDGVISSNGKFL